MPLSKLQLHLLRLLASQRSPDSYIAGAIALNRDGPRFSGDIDIFQDGDERLVAIAENDAAIIARAGFQITWLSNRGNSKRTIRQTHKQIKAMLEAAEAFIQQLPSDAVGMLFLDHDKPVLPDLAALDRYRRHAGARRGHWPSSTQIGTAMLEHHLKPSEQ